jgi:serine-type D-Ala-D-Ala carboxypeptidase (penicillin-binding protein 5/6)
VTRKHRLRSDGRPAHLRRRGATHDEGVSVTAPAPMDAPKVLAETAPEPAEAVAGSRSKRRVLPWLIGVVVIVLIGALVGIQLERRVPVPVFRSTVLRSIRFAGPAPTLPWPSVGSAELMVQGSGILGQVGNAAPVPIASITKVMTAYVVLHDHPLNIGDAGPVIAVTASTLAAYQTGLATDQSVVKVTAGESLTELQCLEGMLIASGNDMASMLADWDAGSEPAFVAKMNADATTIGLRSTHFDDVSGLDPGSVSTAADLITLGQAAMNIPVFRQIVAMVNADLPVAGVVQNYNGDLGQDGIVGIKTGSDSAAGGCLLFDAQQRVGTKDVTLIGVVLGQQGVDLVAAALKAVDVLAKAAFAVLRAEPALAPGVVVGRVVAPWGGSVPVTAASSPAVVGWPGLVLPVRLEPRALTIPVLAGIHVGVFHVGVGGRSIDVVARAARRLPGPSLWWRLTRR